MSQFDAGFCREWWCVGRLYAISYMSLAIRDDAFRLHESENKGRNLEGIYNI